jgi:ferredoxin
MTAPNPVLSTLRWFRDEYEAHIYVRRCPARVCTELLSYRIDDTLCNGCGRCLKECPVDAVVGEPRRPHTIIQERCVACGNCVTVCHRDAVLVS